MIKKISELTIEDIASICDHTFLKRPECFSEEAKKQKIGAVDAYNFAFQKFLTETFADGKPMPYALCVRPEEMANTRHLREKIKVASVVDFPIPDKYLDSLKSDMEYALYWGTADEIDMIFGYKFLNSGKNLEAEYRIKFATDLMSKANNVRKERNESPALLKVILETSELNPDQIALACQICEKYPVDFVKTSTGFSKYGATEEALKIMKANFSGGIKISGGVTPQNVHSLLQAASREKDGYIDLNPMKYRIGESSLLDGLSKKVSTISY